MPELDLLRFLAAVGVVFFHLLRTGPLALPSRYGYLGVPLFFLISGFVILWTATGKTALQFTLARVARLYPSFLVCGILTAIALALAGQAVSLPNLLANLSMLTVVSPKFGAYLDAVYWTLALEIKFYFLIFALLLFKQIHRIEYVLLAWLVVLTLQWPERLTLSDYGALFVGGCCSYLIRAHGVTWRRAVILGWSAVLSVWFATQQHSGFTHLPGVEPKVIVATAIVAMYVLMTAVALRKVRLPASPTWYVLGSMTYPLYLTHDVIAGSLISLLPFDAWTNLAIALAVVLTITSLIAWAVERNGCPGLQRKLLSFSSSSTRSTAARRLDRPA